MFLGQSPAGRQNHKGKTDEKVESVPDPVNIKLWHEKCARYRTDGTDRRSEGVVAKT